MGAERTVTSISKEELTLRREYEKHGLSLPQTERYIQLAKSKQFLLYALELNSLLANRLTKTETPAERERRHLFIQMVRNDLRTSQFLMVDPRPVGWFFGNLPARFQQTVHEWIAHPLSEVLFWFGLRKLADFVHDATIPVHLRVSVGE